jgi:ABC-2 type transport system permease protein
MSTIALEAPSPVARSDVRARQAGFLSDLVSVAGRALRSIPREAEVIGPALFIPLFFFVVNVGALQDFSEQGIASLDYKAFQLPWRSSSRSPASPGPRCS